MNDKFKITIEKIEPYYEETTVYDGTDGKRYTSTWGLPEGVKYSNVKIKTGKIAVNSSEVYMQVVAEDALDLDAVITAINQLK